MAHFQLTDHQSCRQLLIPRSLQTGRDVRQSAWRPTSVQHKRMWKYPFHWVVWSLEYVLISDGGHNIKNNQQDRTSRQSSVLLSPHTSKFATASPLSVATGADLPTPFLSWPCPPHRPHRTDGSRRARRWHFSRGQYGQLSVVASGAGFLGQTPPGMFCVSHHQLKPLFGVVRSCAGSHTWTPACTE